MRGPRRGMQGSTAMRIASALVALPAVLYLMWLGGWAFVGLVLAAAAICLLEFMAMVHKGDRPTQVVMSALGLALMLLGVLGGLVSVKGMLALALLPILIVTYFLFRVGDLSTVAARAGLTVLGIFWVGGLLFAALLGLFPESMAWVLLACILAWGSDTGAYFAGRFLGRHKLYAAVSPKKTWEGAVGGVIVATLGALLEREIIGGPSIPLPHLLLLSPLAAAFGQVGDLAESLLKRSVGVKDSGWIMPGHGGLFDRVDALIFVVVTLYAYAVLALGLAPSWVSLPA